MTDLGFVQEGIHHEKKESSSSSFVWDRYVSPKYQGYRQPGPIILKYICKKYGCNWNQTRVYRSKPEEEIKNCRPLKVHEEWHLLQSTLGNCVR